MTPAGAVSSFASGFIGPRGLAFDAAGNLYVVNVTSNTVSKVSQTVVVPFTLGGSAVSGVAFSDVTAGPLTFGIGQTTQDITGKLLFDPGPSRTLTFTLGTPTGGAVLGSPSVNTLTITESAAVGTTTPTPTSTSTSTSTGSSVPPVFLGEQRVFAHEGKHRKLVGFDFLFNNALDASSAQSTGDYHVTRKRGKKIKVLPVTSTLYDPGNFSVTITVGGFKAGTAAQVTIAGLTGADGQAIPQITTGL